MRLAVCAAALALLAGPALAGSGAYRVSPGDALELRIDGAPELTQRLTVTEDGAIAVPFFGEVQVVGLSVTEIRERLALLLASRSLRLHGPDGQERLAAIRADSIGVTIAEYRPVYVSGDVLTPGQHPFRPAMTGRQLVALAGGLSLVNGRQSAGADLLALQTQYQAVAAQLGKALIHAARLQAELAGKSEIGPLELGGVPISAATAAELLKTENESLRLAHVAQERATATLAAQLEQLDGQRRALTEQQEAVEGELAAEMQDLGRAARAYAGGSLPSPRLLESRRAVSSRYTRRLDLRAALAQLDVQRSELTLKLTTVADAHRASVLDALGQARVELIELRGKLADAAERARLATALDDPARANDDTALEMVVVRHRGSDWQSRPIRLDEPLQPGDVVTVRVRIPSSTVSTQPGTGL